MTAPPSPRTTSYYSIDIPAYGIYVIISLSKCISSIYKIAKNIRGCFRERGGERDYRHTVKTGLYIILLLL